MKKNIYLTSLLLLTFLVGCGKVTEDFLVGGTWISPISYEESKAKETDYCIQFVMEGLEFKEENGLYSIYFDKEYTYSLREKEKTTVIWLDRGTVAYVYNVEIIDKNTIKLTGRNGDPNTEFCTLERQ